MKLSSLKQTRKKIAVFGGSFDPFHYGHLAVVKCLARRFDEVWIMPCFRHPMGKKLTPWEDRYKMCVLGASGLRKVKVSKLEFQLGGESYTIKTLNYLNSNFPQLHFFWVVGVDAFSCIDRWRDPEKLRKFDFVVISREKKEVPFGKPLICKTPKISSSLIRAKIKRGESVETLLPKKVLEYIMKRKLYL